jgi:nucleoside-diphosphate-sugar epimerase
MKEKKALVLGATGTIGSALSIALSGDGWKVFGASTMSNTARNNRVQEAGIEMIKFDVLEDDPAALPDVDILFLEIWDRSRPSLVWPINFYGTGRVVERYSGVADIVNGSTLNIYGDSVDAVVEESPCRPTSYYGHTRLAQEKLVDYFCTRSKKKGINLRYAHVNSVKRGVIRRFAKLIFNEASLGRNPDALIQVISLEDIVRMTRWAVKCMDNPPVNVNCCHPRVWTQRELANAIMEKLGCGKVVFDRETGGSECSSYGDVKKMIEWFGEPRVPVDTLLERVVKDLEKKKK